MPGRLGHHQCVGEGPQGRISNPSVKKLGVLPPESFSVYTEDRPGVLMVFSAGHRPHGGDTSWPAGNWKYPSFRKASRTAR